MITLKSIINKCNIENVVNILARLDEDNDSDAYLAVLEKLKYKGVTNTNFRIVLTRQENDGYSWVDVSGYNVKEKLMYALEFRTWDEWLGMEIDEVTLATFSTDEIVAHSLYEMTYISFDESEIQQQFDEIEQMEKDFLSGKLDFKDEDDVIEDLKNRWKNG